MIEIRTRFAPSPTGYMHIGGMRTALFNWLWARHNNGSFVLRIDDTDRERNIDETLGPILHAFRWMGLDWDEGPQVGGEYGPYFQSQRQERYAEVAQQLLEQGKAFRDFDPPETVRADREAAEKEKRNYLNIRRSLELTEKQIEDYLAEGRPHVVRFLVPREEKIAIDDIVRGHVEWDCALIPDPVILRNDGTPLYNFATVLDDADMKISHVIRAEEHLSNTSIQALIHLALGHELPAFAHIPYVAAPGTKEKLSKREKKIEKYKTNPVFRGLFQIADEVFPRLGLGTSQTLNPVMVEYYEKAGFLSDAVFNTLARLGWSLDDKTEFMTRETVIENFTLERVVKSPAGLDPDKLMALQAKWMNRLSTEEKIEGCLPFLVGVKLFDEPTAEKITNDSQLEYLGRVIEAVGERMKIFSDILAFDDFFIADDKLEYDEKAFQKRLQNAPESVEHLRKFQEVLAELEPFDVATTEKALHDFVEQAGMKIGEIIHALRVAVTGKPKGPGMFDCLAVLGKDRCLHRIGNALSRLVLRQH